MTSVEVLILILVGILSGVLSGMFGVGGGVLIVPALVFFMGMTQHEAQGTSIGLMLLPIGVLAAYNYQQSGDLNIKYGLIIAGAFVIGGYFGSKLSLQISELTLKRLFGGLLMIVSIKLVFFSK
jgi:uncharacterized membrane protein YfcA